MKKILKWVGIILGGVFSLVIVVGVLFPVQTTTRNEAVAAASEMPPARAAQDKSLSSDFAASMSTASEMPESDHLDVTPVEYERRFNDIMLSMNKPYRIKVKSTRIDSATDARGFSIALNDHLQVMGRVDSKSGKVMSVLLMGASDGTKRSVSDIGYAATAALGAATPNGSASTITPEIEALIHAHVAEPNEVARRKFNGVKLMMTITDASVMFAAEPD
ncbi:MULTISPECIES: hypothetical protein [unclassified Paraburkholderia]|uniref:hypothetical protein n=1 Tax=unclassified Paraburkholderia TaxID=2615204 RepID=UPI00162075BA|nr:MULTISPECIES: hypothetical protein [unclassified Paraburkholderia]MBB5447070.1 hypothetical protein [Paraburkholderia sp. WSM4177]MBB5487611.1 hypothetical protein [Paraburkholderia sp. WSM4180]